MNEVSDWVENRLPYWVTGVVSWLPSWVSGWVARWLVGLQGRREKVAISIPSGGRGTPRYLGQPQEGSEMERHHHRYHHRHNDPTRCHVSRQTDTFPRRSDAQEPFQKAYRRWRCLYTNGKDSVPSQGNSEKIVLPSLPPLSPLRMPRKRPSRYNKLRRRRVKDEDA